MYELGLAYPFWVIVLIWLARVILLALICTLLAWLGIRVLDVLTPHIHERQRIGESPIATGLFIAGFFILVGLVIHGAITALTVVVAPILGYIFDFRTWGVLAISFVISLLVGIALFHIVDKLTPRIPFISINKSPVAVGIYVFGYLVFFGLILHAALTTPL
ncbi:MAG TPA: DUF350 domain-containing protein [Dehalococcoidia bacterium]|jgi:uncharacterized membrane protein YjfL (UPF0719 family)|nr:DUF350 domain-containing protein [Dehalococcoidia bacterium]